MSAASGVQVYGTPVREAPQVARPRIRYFRERVAADTRQGASSLGAPHRYHRLVTDAMAQLAVAGLSASRLSVRWRSTRRGRLRPPCHRYPRLVTVAFRLLAAVGSDRATGLGSAAPLSPFGDGGLASRRTSRYRRLVTDAAAPQTVAVCSLTLRVEAAGAQATDSMRPATTAAPPLSPFGDGGRAPAVRLYHQTCSAISATCPDYLSII
jgi:hypothetical protein